MINSVQNNPMQMSAAEYAALRQAQQAQQQVQQPANPVRDAQQVQQASRPQSQVQSPAAGADEPEPRPVQAREQQSPRLMNRLQEQESSSFPATTAQRQIDAQANQASARLAYQKAGVSEFQM